eukprot:CAMPEP_0201489220 /NCGR_PEP_ID=MMETSP0151_2-20130828/21342_1 /ASSEMBLY_ACC=CAM_ASM_000257 /TAXON_ID=200890 /ORGANISM="Paramoeba atlantica, Strain 621/1 / CCAP 1560/9" /LENGTH=186 /DNA_ID=CAMNT_0047874735 /DNA_START=84 /DNA_END=644 /DNA_ORIENTATION=+
MAVVQPNPSLRQALLSLPSHPAPSSLEEEVSSASPSAPSSSSKRKKNKFYFDRNSLQTRYRRGRPGTRRYQRWLNEMYLEHDWSDLNAPELDVDIFELNEEALGRPSFSFVTSFDENPEVLYEFWYSEFSEEEEDCWNEFESDIVSDELEVDFEVDFLLGSEEDEDEEIAVLVEDFELLCQSPFLP